MVRDAEIQRDYRAAGALHRLLGVWGFVDDAAFLTKAGHVGVLFRLHGVDDEGLTHSQRAAIAHRYEAALRLLDERCRVYQYLLKRTVDPFVASSCTRQMAQQAISRHVAHLNARRSALFQSEAYLAIVYETPIAPQASTRLRQIWSHPREALRSWLSSRDVCLLLERQLDDALAALHDKADTVAVHLRELGLRRLDKIEAFQFLRRLANPDPLVSAAASLRYDAHVDYFLADSAVECHRDHLLVGSRRVQVLSMKEPPSRTFAHILADLHAIPGEYIACLEWQRLPADRVRRDLQMRRRHFFNKRISAINYLSSETRSDEMLVDDSASTLVRLLGDALTEIEVEGHFFGVCSLTLALHGEDRTELQQATAEAMKTLAAHDGSFFLETYNLLNAWLSIFPGNGKRNLRRLAVLETNAADLSFLFTRNVGERISPHLGRQALVTLQTPHHTPYAFNLHVNDVGNTLVLGATGSGKSFLLNVLVTHAQQYEPLTVIFDLGHSYRKLASLLEGQYLEIGLGRSAVSLNPFAFDPTPEQLHFAHAFVRVLLEGEDGYRVNEREDREVYDAVENLYVLDRDQRRLFTLANLLPRALAARLHRWIEGGPYAALFDHLEDTLTVDSLQVFDFESASAYPALLDPLLFYVLHRFRERVLDRENVARFKLCVMDEAPLVIQHPMVRAHVWEFLKTCRKHNAAMILATQMIEDFASTDLLRTVIESCPTKLLLANPTLDRRVYADLFRLNETELDLLSGLAPRREMLLKRPDLTKVLVLDVDPKSYWIFTNTPVDNERVRAMVQEHGLDGGLDRLAASA